MDRVVAAALRHRALVVVLMLFVFGAGTAAFMRLNIEAYPDPVPPLVEVIAQNPGQSAEEIERYITIPIEVQMAGIPHLASLRTISVFGLSDVRVQFTYGVTYEQAEQWVINRLAQLSPLPNGVSPQISPESPIGEILRYRVVGPPHYSVTDLKTLEDWVLERRFKAVPGVIDVDGWGRTKSYEVTIDQNQLAHYSLTVPQVLAALNNADINVGGQTVTFGPQAAVVRGIGLIHSMDDIRNTILSPNGGSPVMVSDVATVSVGHLPRLGIAAQDDDDDIVQGIVLMRRGAESLPTIRRVEAEMRKINDSGVLPPGVRVEKIYDRSELIQLTTRTVLRNMLAGMALIVLVQFLFLGSLRSAVVVAATLPFALAFAIGLMLLRGESANLLSVGAIDFGLIADATVIMVENIFRRLAQRPEQRFAYALPADRTDHAADLHGKLCVIVTASAEVNRSIFFSAAIIVAGFVPLFAMSGVEANIFGPMAKTYAYAIAGGLLAAFTISPALSALLLDDRAQETETIVVRALRRLYRPVLAFTLANRILVLGTLVLLLLSAGGALRTLGLEFLPKLEEGNFLIGATMPAGISLEEGNGYVNRMRRLLRGFPEVATVVSQQGRPDDGTDTTGFFNAEFFVPLKPQESWPAGVDKENLAGRMTAALAAEFPAVDFYFSQYIEDNVEESAIGVKGESSVKLFGDDLAALEKTAKQIKSVLATVPGITDLGVRTALGQPTLRIDIDRVRAARYGLAPGDVNATVQAAIGGQAAGNLYENGSDRNFPIIARLAPEFRHNLETIRRIAIGAPAASGGTVPIPLTDVATVRLASGASFIYREQQQRYIPITFSVRGRDLGGAVLEARQKVAEHVLLPGGFHLEWVGEFGNLEDALARLAVLVPLSVVLICLLLYVNFGSVTDMLLAASVIPMALAGGIFALYVSATPFSVSAAIGFVALFGISTMDGIILLICFNRTVEAGFGRAAAIWRTGQARLRPAMMTSVVAAAGLLPAALSEGIGAQVQRPLAFVVVGGALLGPVLILLVLPVLIDLFSRRPAPARLPDGSASPAE
jgi:cobalt-zinc-cadmium resistance protein CzcA